MTSETLAHLLADLRRDEGLRLMPYRDTVGKLTIGYGRNLDDNGITREEAELMLRHDALTHLDELYAALPWVKTLDPVRQRVLANMAFNLGIPLLMKFTNTLAAVRRGAYVEAAERMLASKWARQVKGRAVRLAAMMRDGVDAG